MSRLVRTFLLKFVVLRHFCRGDLRRQWLTTGSLACSNRPGRMEQGTDLWRNLRFHKVKFFRNFKFFRGSIGKGTPKCSSAARKGAGPKIFGSIGICCCYKYELKNNSVKIDTKMWFHLTTQGSGWKSRRGRATTTTPIMWKYCPPPPPPFISIPFRSPWMRGDIQSSKTWRGVTSLPRDVWRTQSMTFGGSFGFFNFNLKNKFCEGKWFGKKIPV